MSAAHPDEERIRRNIQRTVGQRVLRELRAIADEDRRAHAADARFLRGCLKYGIIIVLAPLLAHLLGVF